ncbi:MAG: DNA repair protein RecO [Deltaproteobacteria bacterium]|nr:DNA repair protein RecO [Deltaproteobacteria bacterium]
MSAGDLGVVLKTTPLRESDLVVTLYTESLGRISAVARGARRSQRRFAGTLSLLVLGRYQLGRPPRGDMWGLEGGEIVREWTQLASDVVGVAHASYVVELVGSLLPPESPDPIVLELVVAMWDSLVEGGPSPAALRSFELALLDLAGHRPALDTCAACGGAVLDGGAVFDPTRGGAICRSCAAISRSPGVRPLEPSTIGYLAAIAAHDNPGEARVLDTDPRFANADRAAGRDALVTMVSLLVGRPLRSLEYIAKLGAAARRHDS